MLAKELSSPTAAPAPQSISLSMCAPVTPTLTPCIDAMPPFAALLVFTAASTSASEEELSSLSTDGWLTAIANRRLPPRAELAVATNTLVVARGSMADSNGDGRPQKVRLHSTSGDENATTTFLRSSEARRKISTARADLQASASRRGEHAPVATCRTRTVDTLPPPSLLLVPVALAAAAAWSTANTAAGSLIADASARKEASR
mmetsp:Transcript_13944/g.34411  ORF Transcript_13944/g.34411 Transcript_13944/m.34411 type:complete len:204 (-) Transcript_13944:70-681(-)